MMSSPKSKISFWHRLLDMISPKACAACRNRLGLNEHVMCGKCNLHLARTNYCAQPYDNDMAKMFWGRISIEKAAALFFYQPQSQTAQLIYNLKYYKHEDYGELLGEMTAREFAEQHFFDDIDDIIPIPLTKGRESSRGYNQSERIAQGISTITNLPVLDCVVIRESFNGSQTDKDRWQRNENVENVFQLRQDAPIEGKHLLIVDDIVTSGATTCACATELQKVKDVKISVLTLGFTKT